MRQNLLETYSRQLKVAEAYVAKTFDGKEVSNNTKLATTKIKKAQELGVTIISEKEFLVMAEK